MKMSITLLTLLIAQISLAQLKFGTYQMAGNRNDLGGGRLFSKLIIRKDQSFRYEYRTSTSCFLWYDLEGSWEISKDQLILTDTVVSSHSVVRFTSYKETSNGAILIQVRSREGQALEGICIRYQFKDTKDTLSGQTDSAGRLVIDTRGRTPSTSTGKYRTIDDVQIWVVYVDSKGVEHDFNNFSDLSANWECVIDGQARDEMMIRTTRYAINGPDLIFVDRQYNRKDPQPQRLLFGNFRFGEE